MNLEEFKQVEGFPNYLISEYGNVWDKRQNKELKWIKNNDFNCVNLRNAEKRELAKIHQLVAKAFLVKPDGATNIVLHKDLDRNNNHFTNLEWKIRGVANKAHLCYSNYHGVKYHLVELEEISEKSGLPLWTVRNRLEDGYTVKEIYQGYKDCDVRVYDGLVFTNIREFKKFTWMLDEDVRKKDYYLKQCEWREARFMEDVRRETLKKEEEIRRVKRGTDDTELIASAIDLLGGIKDRCYSEFGSRRYNKNYAGRGVVVSDLWNCDADVFVNWYSRNYIKGWEIDKDIIPLYEMRDNLEYSEENCCFVPKWMNHWFAKVGNISISKDGSRYFFYTRYSTMTCGNRKLYLSSDSEEGVFEQYLLTKDLQFEKRVWETMVGYELLRKRNPNTPEIHPTLISIISNYSTEKYLKLKNIAQKT